jgi:hypothetical protein
MSLSFFVVCVDDDDVEARSMVNRKKKTPWTRSTARTELIPPQGLEMRQGRATGETRTGTGAGTVLLQVARGKEEMRRDPTKT